MRGLAPAQDREVSPLERPVSERTYTLSIPQSLHWSEEEGEVSEGGKAPLSGRMRSDLSAAVNCGHPCPRCHHESSVFTTLRLSPPVSTGIRPLLTRAVPLAVRFSLVRC